MIYFTSDLHLGHKNVLKLCNRPFSSIEEMDACLIENWNARVTNNDTIYILGDLMFRNSVPPEEYLSQLKGKKHLIRGNHDRDWIKKVDISKYFVSNENLSFFSDGKHHITGCHYPMMSWPHMSTTGYMVFGHIHHNTDAVYWPIIEQSELMLNAGVDINGFKPVTFDEMVINNKKHKIRTRLHRKICEDGTLLERKFSLIEKLEELLNSDVWDDETEKYIKSMIVEFEKSLKCERYSHHGYPPSFLQEAKKLLKGEPIKCEKTYLRHFLHRKGEKYEPDK